MKLLERITNKKIQDVMPTMYNSEEIEKGGATVREMKVRSALQYGFKCRTNLNYLKKKLKQILITNDYLNKIPLYIEDFYFTHFVKNML